MQRIVKFLAWYAALTLAASFGLLLTVYPHRPRTLIGWICFLVLAIPVTLFGESIGEFVSRNRVAKAVDSRTIGVAFSWLRIGYGLVAMLLVFGALWGLALFLGIDGTAE